MSESNLWVQNLDSVVSQYDDGDEFITKTSKKRKVKELKTMFESSDDNDAKVKQATRLKYDFMKDLWCLEVFNPISCKWNIGEFS